MKTLLVGVLLSSVGCVAAAAETAPPIASALDACDREDVTDDASLTSQLYAEHAFHGRSVPDLLANVTALGEWPDGSRRPVPVVVVAPGRVRALCGTMYATEPTPGTVVTNNYAGAHRVVFVAQGR